MFSQANIRLEIDEALKNKGWKLTGREKNVFTERSSTAGRADYVLQPKGTNHPLVIIEAKKRGRDLNQALQQAKRYATKLKAPIAYASDGSTIKTLHLSTLKPLILNGEKIDEFVSENLALHYLHSNEHNTIEKQVMKSRKELISIFSSANKELRKEGLQAGIERFSEFCNILFLKIFSEEEETRKKQGMNLRIPIEFNWDYFKNKDGNELLFYVNDTVLKHFQKEYGTDIFSPLQIKNPLTLKRIIDKLDPLSLVDTQSDIKGDAFEYFLKAYLANQNKDLGEYFTPRHIVKTLVKLVNPKFGEAVYDPFCGTGGMLIEAFRHIYNKMPRNNKTLAQLKKETIYGCEITRNARITKMNMILTGDGHNNIHQKDSLKNPSKKKYDIVITNMPFSLGSYVEYSGLYPLGSSNGNSLCIEHCFDAIDVKSGNPRIGIIVPEGILFDKKFKKLREYIYQNSHVQNIVSLPCGAFKPYTEVKTSLFYLTKVGQKKEKQKAIWHYTVKNDGYTLNTKRKKKEGDNDLDTFLSFNDIDDENKLLRTGFNKLNMSEVAKNHYVSIPSPYKSFEFNSKFENLTLGELIEAYELKNDQNAKVWSITNDKGFMLATKRFLEQVAKENKTQYKIVLPYTFAYNPSRINVGSIAFNNSDNIGCVSPMYVVFEVSRKNRLHPIYLYWLLQSEQFKEQISTFAIGSVRQTVNFNDFCKITIPLPNIEQQRKIIEELTNYKNIIDNTTKAMDGWKPYFAIDKDWKMAAIQDICIVNPKKEQTSLEKCSFLPMEDMKTNKIYVYPKQIRAVKAVKKGYTYFKENDLLIAKITPCFENNKMSIVKNLNNKVGYSSTEFIVVRALENVSIAWVYNCLQNLGFINEGKTVMTGSVGQQRIKPDFVKNYSIPLPAIATQKEIISTLETERRLIDSQKDIIKLFQGKMKTKLNALWQ